MKDFLKGSMILIASFLSIIFLHLLGTLLS